MPVRFDSSSPEMTQAWARELAAGLQAPLVIALIGNLGAGKTQVAKGIAAGLGVTTAITSPTFTLINEYDLPGGGVLFHVDCYRLQEAETEARQLGLGELFDQGIVLIEWADRIPALLPPARIDIYLSDAGPGCRRIELHDLRPAAPLLSLLV